MRRWYSECVRHFLAFYVSTLEVGTCPKFRTTSEKINWMACDAVVKTLDPQDQALVRELYRQGDTMADKIFQIAKDRKSSQGHLWNLVDDLEQKIAKERGLL